MRSRPRRRGRTGAGRWPAPSSHRDGWAIPPEPRRTARWPRRTCRRSAGCRPGGPRSRRAGRRVTSRTTAHRVNMAKVAAAMIRIKRRRTRGWARPARSAGADSSARRDVPRHQYLTCAIASLSQAVCASRTVWMPRSARSGMSARKTSAVAMRIAERGVAAGHGDAEAGGDGLQRSCPPGWGGEPVRAAAYRAPDGRTSGRSWPPSARESACRRRRCGRRSPCLRENGGTEAAPPRWAACREASRWRCRGSPATPRAIDSTRIDQRIEDLAAQDPAIDDAYGGNGDDLVAAARIETRRLGIDHGEAQGAQRRVEQRRRRALPG